jgi:uncharacterized membrane protein
MRARVSRDDQGAAAVEFALVSVLLFTLLFGIIQYGFLFFQYQAAAATAHQAARQAAEGIDDCVSYADAVEVNGENNGLATTSLKVVDVDWRGAVPAHGVSGVLTLTYKPTNFQFPFVPFPSTLTAVAAITVEGAGSVLGNCRTRVNP